MSDTPTLAQPHSPQAGSPPPDKTTQVVLTVSSLIMFAIAVIFLLGLCLIQIWVIPKFLEIFQDFDTQLPSLTIFLLQIPTAIYLAVYLLGMVALLVKECIPQLHISIKLAVNLIVIVLCLIMAIVYFLGLQLPMVQLMESMM